MILTENSDYFLEQRQPVDLFNGEELCFFCGPDLILKYYLDEHRLQRVKVNRECNLDLIISFPNISTLPHFRRIY
jgi:hypothetical protein